MSDAEKIKALEERVAGLATALSVIAKSAPCKNGHESFNSPGQPCDQIIASRALKDSAPILARVRAQAKAEAWEDAARSAGCECSSAAPTQCALCSWRDWLGIKAAELRREAAK